MSKTSLSDLFKMKRKFERVLNTDFNGASIGHVKRAIESSLGPLPFINWPMDNSWAVIRARQINESKEDITQQSTFGVPPAIETSQGRANLVNHPVLYGTFDSRTAMQEIKAPIESECYVSIWEFKRPPDVTTFLSSVDPKNDLFGLNKLIPTDLPRELEGGYTIKSLNYALKLRASAFTSRNYEFTSKIAHDVIYNNAAKSVGLLYPSVVDPYRCNIALNPKYVTQEMECVRVYKMIWSGAFIFKVLARGSLVNENIHWNKTGSYDFDEIDRKYSGSNGPNEIHESALEILNQKREP
ncbi:MAG: RES family NAD+ phosphorylase [Candidatus Thiodiazotropha taylori]